MVHQQGLHDLGERFHRARRHAAGHAVEVFGRGDVIFGGRRQRLRGRFQGQFLAASQHAQHGILGLDGRRRREFLGRRAIESMPLAPLGQLEVVAGAVHRQGRPLPLVALLQSAAIALDGRDAQADLAVGKCDPVVVVFAGDLSFDRLAVAKEEHALAGAGLFGRRDHGPQGQHRRAEGFHALSMGTWEGQPPIHAGRCQGPVPFRPPGAKMATVPGGGYGVAKGRQLAAPGQERTPAGNRGGRAVY